MRKSVDTPLLLTLCALVIFGLLIFTSAALGLLARDQGASFTSVAVSQLLLGLVCGSILLVTFTNVDYRLWRPYTPYFFGAAMVLTLLTFIPGIGLELKGASRWIAVGPVSFQPEEILKLATVAFLAAVYAGRFKQIDTFKFGILPLGFIGGSAATLLLLQPNTAGVVILGMATTAVLFAAGGKLWHLGTLALIGVGLVAAAALFYPHVQDRIMTYIHHDDPRGSGYQIEQSLIAVGSGGFSGRGFGQSIEKFSYLPEPIGDSIFAVAAEEFGFIGSTILVLLFATFGLLALRIASRAADPFGGLLVVGLSILIIGQSFFNIASTLGLIPLIGVPLIFVSHGGTALAFALAEVGIILNVSKRMKS